MEKVLGFVIVSGPLMLSGPFVVLGAVVLNPSDIKTGNPAQPPNSRMRASFPESHTSKPSGNGTLLPSMSLLITEAVRTSVVVTIGVATDDAAIINVPGANINDVLSPSGNSGASPPHPLIRGNCTCDALHMSTESLKTMGPAINTGPPR